MTGRRCYGRQVVEKAGGIFREIHFHNKHPRRFNFRSTNDSDSLFFLLIFFLSLKNIMQMHFFYFLRLYAVCLRFFENILTVSHVYPLGTPLMCSQNPCSAIYNTKDTKLRCFNENAQDSFYRL